MTRLQTDHPTKVELIKHRTFSTWQEKHKRWIQAQKRGDVKQCRSSKVGDHENPVQDELNKQNDTELVTKGSVRDRQTGKTRHKDSQ